jgi:hypothetical protein
MGRRLESIPQWKADTELVDRQQAIAAAAADEAELRKLLREARMLIIPHVDSPEWLADADRVLGKR